MNDTILRAYDQFKVKNRQSNNRTEKLAAALTFKIKTALLYPQINNTNRQNIKE